MTLGEYLHALKGRRAAVIGIGVSNTPLIRMLLRAGVDVTACDRKDRAALGGRGVPHAGTAPAVSGGAAEAGLSDHLRNGGVL